MYERRDKPACPLFSAGYTKVCPVLMSKYSAKTLNCPFVFLLLTSPQSTATFRFGCVIFLSVLEFHDRGTFDSVARLPMSM